MFVIYPTFWRHERFENQFWNTMYHCGVLRYSSFKKERPRKITPGGVKKKKGNASKPQKENKNSKRKSAKNYLLRHEQKKESSSKSLNDVTNSKRKSAKNYPRRGENKGELLKVSK